MARDNYQTIEKHNLDAATIIISTLCGLLFGFATVKALAASLFAGALISLCGNDAKSRFYASRRSHSNGPVSVCVGGVLTGCGMVLAGSEPAAAFAQAGSGIWSGYSVILGGLLAVFCYGFLYGDFFSRFDEQGRSDKVSLDETLKCEYWHLAIPFGVVTAMICYFLETRWTSGWTSDVPYGLHTNNSWLPDLSDAAWNPYYVGAFAGLIQIPLRTSLYCLLDSTSAYITTICVPMKFIFDRCNCTLPNWFNNRSSSAGLWSLIFFVSAGGGAYLSALSGGMVSYEFGFGSEFCLLGGFCLVLGSLIAGSCPTGMAVSGCSDLNITSMLATLCIFGSAIGMAKLFESQNIHTERASSFLTIGFINS